ncbi:MAG TPA: STAS domain-containing protein [Kofleriaceae bacterium]
MPSDNELSEELDSEVHDRVADILILLSEVSVGEYGGRLSTTLPENHPFGALNRGINDMVAALAESREQTEKYQRELEEKLTTIERQRSAIRELSTPIIEVWDGVLCLPVVGVLDTSRSVEMTESLMRAILDNKARCVIIDITGIDVMDTRTADHFIRMAKALRHLGTFCYLTGIKPVIAQTIVDMGIDMNDVATRRNLRDALQEYVMRGRPRMAGARPNVPEPANGSTPTR